jgi:phospholipid-binding lipoprotein MlaA
MDTHLISRSRLLFVAILLSFFASLSVAETPDDPWEGYNRAMFNFNSSVDSALLKPIAKGYDKIVPNPVQKGVSNFFSNLGEISNLTNNLLQGKPDGVATSFFRFVINSTAGWGGLFDVATELGLVEKEEDFGQTLGYWGVGAGPYVILPFLGSSTVRDTGGLAVDYANYDPVEILALGNKEELGLTALEIIDLRASFLSAESLIFGDRYTFIRDVYLQTRDRAIRDGKDKASKKNETSDDSRWGEETDSWGEETDSWGDIDEELNTI